MDGFPLGLACGIGCGIAVGIGSGMRSGQANVRKKIEELISRDVVRITDKEGNPMSSDDFISAVLKKRKAN